MTVPQALAVVRSSSWGGIGASSWWSDNVTSAWSTVAKAGNVLLSVTPIPAMRHAYAQAEAAKTRIFASIAAAPAEARAAVELLHRRALATVLAIAAEAQRAADRLVLGGLVALGIGGAVLLGWAWSPAGLAGTRGATAIGIEGVRTFGSTVNATGGQLAALVRV